MNGSRVPPEDRALFRRAVGEARPVSDERVRPDRRRPPPRPRPRDDEAGGAPSRHGLAEAAPFESGPAEIAGETLWYAGPGIQDRVLRRLRRGQIPIEDDLDLHGMTVARAGEALAAFLAGARARGVRCVRLVHGKGRSSGGRGAVLKAHVDRWLRAREEVAAFCTARAPDGGAGALYVLLKRARD